MKRRPDARFVVGWFGGFDGCASTFVCGMDVRGMWLLLERTKIIRPLTVRPFILVLINDHSLLVVTSKNNIRKTRIAFQRKQQEITTSFDDNLQRQPNKYIYTYT